MSLPLAETVAMVLAAGLGKRMRPLTDSRPKPLVPVAGRTLLDHVLDRLVAGGVRRAVVNAHYFAEQIEAHLAGERRLAIEVSDERDALLETGGGVRRALPRLGRTFLVLNSDSLWIEAGAPALATMAAAWNPESMDALLLLAARDSLGYDGAGDFDRASDGRLARRSPGGTAAHVYAGVAILEAASFADTPDGAFSLNLIFDRAIAAGRLHGLPLAGEWLHVGTPEAVGPAERRIAAAAGSG